jgi:4-hydroxybenzoyl-CoA thioesterase
MNDRSTQREVARGKTGIVFFDYETRKVAPMPAAFRDKLARFKAPSALALSLDQAQSVPA